MKRWILPLALFAAAGLARAEDKKPDAPKPDPEATPLELKLTGKTTKFPAPADADALKKQVQAAQKAKFGGKLPPAPAVDLTLEIKNTSDKPVTVWTTGDPVVLTLMLKGQGAGTPR